MEMITIRASSLSDLFDCPARWEARHIRQISSPSGSKAMLGKAVHASTAVFDQAVIDGSGVTADEAAAAAVDTLYKPNGDVSWDEESPDALAPVALALHKKYCETVTPKQQYVAVEIQCDSLEITDLDIALTGTIDRLKQTENGYGIADLKTGKAVVTAAGDISVGKYAYQMGMYELMAECASGLPITEPAEIIGLNAGKTAAAQRVATKPIANARDLLLGDEDSPGVLVMASKLLHSGLFFGNPRSMMCHRNYCPIFNICKHRSR